MYYYYLQVWQFDLSQTYLIYGNYIVFTEVLRTFTLVAIEFSIQRVSTQTRHWHCWSRRWVTLIILCCIVFTFFSHLYVYIKWCLFWKIHTHFFVYDEDKLCVRNSLRLKIKKKGKGKYGWMNLSVLSLLPHKLSRHNFLITAAPRPVIIITNWKYI